MNRIQLRFEGSLITSNMNIPQAVANMNPRLYMRISTPKKSMFGITVIPRMKIDAVMEPNLFLTTVAPRIMVMIMGTALVIFMTGTLYEKA